jgi:hypothetical protein
MDHLKGLRVYARSAVQVCARRETVLGGVESGSCEEVHKRCRRGFLAFWEMALPQEVEG